MRTALAAVFALAALASSAFAHGGAWRYPDSPPPDDSCEPSPDRAERAKAYADWTLGWTLWWAHNRDEFLRDRRAVRRPPATDGIDAAVAEKIVPALRAMLDEKDVSFHIVSAAEIALARIGDASIVPRLEQFVRNADQAYHRETVETAALALGLLGRGRPDVRATLVGLLAAPPGGSFRRQFAAVGLALSGPDEDHAAANALLAAARMASTDDMPRACVFALGVLGDETAVPALLELMESKIDDESLRAEIAGALGRIGSPGSKSAVVEALIRRLSNAKKSARDVRRSAVVALGRIGARGDATTQTRIIDALEKLVAADVDASERQFALISMARIASAHGVEPATRKRVVDLLRTTLAEPKGFGSCFAAFGLGLVGRAVVDEGGAAPEETIRAPLRARFAEDKDVKRRGAYAIASALARDGSASTPLLSALATSAAGERVRSASAVALGLLGVGDATGPIRSALHGDPYVGLRVEYAQARALLGDVSASDDLLNALRDRDSTLTEIGAAANALGVLRDVRSIDALLDVARDDQRVMPDLSRAMAVVALGQIGERCDVTPLARLAEDVNYRALTPPIRELLDIL